MSAKDTASEFFNDANLMKKTPMIWRNFLAIETKTLFNLLLFALDLRLIPDGINEFSPHRGFAVSKKNNFKKWIFFKFGTAFGMRELS
jgi:hypothetical protein